MERYNKKLKDTEVSKALDHIYDNALGNIQIIEGAPTSPDDMKTGIGYYDGTFYFKLVNGKLFSIDGTEITQE